MAVPPSRFDLRPYELAEAPNSTASAGNGLYTVVATTPTGRLRCVECQSLDEIKAVLERLINEHVSSVLRKDWDLVWEARVFLGSQLDFTTPRVWWDELVEKGPISSEDLNKVYDEVEQEADRKWPDDDEAWR
jgi:hypothetical protein